MEDTSSNGELEKAAERLVTVIERLDGMRVPRLDAVLSRLQLDESATRDAIQSALANNPEVVTDIYQMYGTTQPPVNFQFSQ